MQVKDPIKLKSDITKRCTDCGMKVSTLKEIFKVTPIMLERINKEKEAKKEGSEQGYYLDMGTLVNAENGVKT